MPDTPIIATTDNLLSRTPWVVRRPISVAEYHRMGEIGILHQDDRVELIEGELIAISPIGSEHSGAVNALNRLLVTRVGARGVVGVQNPVRLSKWTEPQPDFAVLKPREDDYRSATPTASEVLLLIEVANSSLRYDRALKIPLYARHGIAEFWILNIPGGLVEVHRDPAGGSYATTRQAGRGETLSPPLLPDVALPVSLLLG